MTARLSRLACAALLLLSGFAGTAARATDGFRVVASYPHDRDAFTQGLVYIDGHLYESTGINGKSSLREEDLATGGISRFHDVPHQYFAEGLTDWGNTLVQLTWETHIGFVYDRATFHLLKTFQYPGEGWGLTHDAKSLILSDGTANLKFLDPLTFKVTRTVAVRDKGKPVTQLNELEWIHGEIWANIWHSDRIARISPATGNVLGWIDMTGLLSGSEKSSPEAVLNGIAYDAAHDRIFVTGKLWPKIFEIKVVSAAKTAPAQTAKKK